MTKLQDAAGMIQTLLYGGEQVPVTRIFEIAEEMGISVSTVIRAKESLGNVESKRVEGLAGEGYWVWQLSENR